MVFEWTKKDALNLRAEVSFLPALYIHHVAHAICFRACYLNRSTRSATRVPASPPSTKSCAALACARPPPFWFHFDFGSRPERKVFFSSSPF